MELNDFLLTTDAPLDKIVYLNSGSFSVTSGSSPLIAVPHSLSYRPLLIGTWSTDPNFTISYEQGTSGFAGNSVPQLTIQSTDTDIRFVPLNNTGSTVTYYWRVFGFMPSDVDVDAPFTEAQADKYSLNTDYNYTKLWQEGIFLWSSGSTQVVNHNFGYRPQVEIWYEEDLNANLLTKYYLGLDSSYTGFNRVRITDTQVIFNFNSTTGVAGRKWYYRVYADKATL